MLCAGIILLNPAILARSVASAALRHPVVREEPERILEDGFVAWPIIVAWIHYVAIMLLIAYQNIRPKSSGDPLPQPDKQ